MAITPISANISFVDDDVDPTTLWIAEVEGHLNSYPMRSINRMSIHAIMDALDLGPNSAETLVGILERLGWTWEGCEWWVRPTPPG